MLIRKRGECVARKKKEAVELSTLSPFPMILIRNVREKEGGMFIFSIMAGLCSHLSGVCLVFCSV